MDRRANRAGTQGPLWFGLGADNIRSLRERTARTEGRHATDMRRLGS
jgi:hypothetical protein